MRSDEAETLATLQTLFAAIAELRQMIIRDLLDPGNYAHYQKTLAAAYDALVKVEDALDSIGTRLENEHWRIGSAFTELEPLLIKPRTRADAALEFFEQKMKRFERTFQQSNT